MKTVTRVAVSNDKVNKTRSILIILSIILTTTLLTIIACYGYGAIKNNKVNADKLYGSYYGTFSKVNEKQLQQMQLRGEFTEIGKTTYFASVEKTEAKMGLYYIDDTAANLTNFSDSLEQGALPQQANEITGQQGFFKQLGYSNPQIGDKIVLDYRFGNDSKIETREFVITGMIKTNEQNELRNAYGAYVSPAFYQQAIPEQQRTYTVCFRLGDSVLADYDTAEDTLKELAVKCEIDENNVSINKAYLMWILDPGTETIAGCLLIALVIILFSVVVIYNIFQVGIVQKVQEYGKIKALGATKKQLKQIVFREGMLLALIAIPIGLVIGYLIATVSYDWFAQQAGQLTGEKVSMFSVPVMILVAFIAALTTWLALRKPMKIVASVSPVEAMRFQGAGGNSNGLRKGKLSLKVKDMTFASLSDNRKRTISTILTMGLSCVLFVVLANLASSIDDEYEARKDVEFGQFCLSLDYSLNDTAYPENNLEAILKNNPFDEQLLEKIQAIEGVTEVQNRNIISAFNMSQGKKDSGENTSVAVFNRQDFEKYAARAGGVGILDYDSVTAENGIILSYSYFMESDGYSLNETVPLAIASEDGTKETQFKLMGGFGRATQSWVMTEDTYKNLRLNGNMIGYIWIDCKEKNIESVQAKLEQLIAERSHIEISSYKDALKLANMSSNFLKIAIYGFLIVVGIIGFMNMANTIITSIITRRRELGVLQAIGMTNKQLNYMLQLEGLVFTVGTVLVSLVIGCPLGYGAFLYASYNGYFGLNIYHFPVVEIAIMIAAITIMQLTLSYILSRNLHKDSLVERISYQG